MEGSEGSIRSNPVFNPDQNQSQQPGAGESQNTPMPPFHAQGSQPPPRVGGGKKGRIQQNRYAVPTTMHYSESSQAEAGQQIDRLRHLNQPVPSALLNENPDIGSNPSNAQNIRPPVFNIENIQVDTPENHNEQMAAFSENTEEMFQQFSNGQQDSAQPGVPATNNNPPVPEELEGNPRIEVDQPKIGESPQDAQDISDIQQTDSYSFEEGKNDSHSPTEESKEHSNVQNFEREDPNQERQGLEDEIRANHQDEPALDHAEFNSDSPYSSSIKRRNEQFSSSEKEMSGLEFIKKTNANSRKQSNSRQSNTANQPFGYSMPHRSGTYSSFVVPNSVMNSSDNANQLSSYLQLSRNTQNPGSGGHSESVSSFPVTNYEDSEFMIQAYQRKKKSYEKCKTKLLQAESDLHMEKQRCKMFQEETKRLKMSYKKLEKKYKQQIQANAKQEKEQLRRALELSNKEKEMYKNDRENLKKDNLKIRKAMQELVNQNYMLLVKIKLML